MEQIAVLGAGIMGAAIAQSAALGGYKVILRDLQKHLVDIGLDTIDKNLTEMVENGTINQLKKEGTQLKIQGTTDLSELRDVDIVIEAVVENIAVKKQIFAELDNLCGTDTILATNTSSLSITEIAASTKRTDKVLGMHFFNPVDVVNLVEIIKGLETSEATVAKAIKFCEKIGKMSLLVQRESPGYVVNRVLFSYINEAIFLYADNVAEKEAIDSALKLSMGSQLGPLELADRVGLDYLYNAIAALYDEFKDPKYRPHPLLATMIRAGHLGVKSGRGFYTYQDNLSVTE